MAVVRQSGVNPNAGKVNTTMGLREARPPLCWTCHERREGEIYGISANGAPICSTCATKKVLATECEDSK
jgi:hypothetical protein